MMLIPLSGCCISKFQTNNLCDVLITQEKLFKSGQKKLTDSLARDILKQDLIYKELCQDEI